MIANPPEFPTGVLHINGHGLLYFGQVNSIIATSWTGKSLLALFGAWCEMLLGKHVAYFDFEADEAVAVSRLLKMGADPALIASHFHYFSPEHPLLGDQGKRATSDLLAVMSKCSLGIVDAKGEALVNEQGLLKDAEPTIAFVKRLGSVAEVSGACALLLDHPPGDGTAKKDGFGSVYNTNAIRGVVIHLEAVTLPQPGAVGVLKLFVRKDRHSEVAPHGLPQDDRRVYMADVKIDSTTPMLYNGHPAHRIKIEMMEPNTLAAPSIFTTNTERLMAMLLDHYDRGGRPFSARKEVVKASGIRQTDGLAARQESHRHRRCCGDRCGPHARSLCGRVPSERPDR